MQHYLALAWVGIIAFGIILYVILDGVDLGIGMLFPFFPDEKDRDIMLSTILPVWDGNQTWLVFSGATLYGAFPWAFSTLLPLAYLPILLMVIALIFRGISFEFRLKTVEYKKTWDYCFFAGSLCATLAQGLLLGNFIQGFHLSNIAHPIESYQWASPFCAFCAIALVIGYMLLGADRLIYKTVGPLQEKCFKFAHILQYLLLLFFIVMLFWTPYVNSFITQKWIYTYKPWHLGLIWPTFACIFWFLHYKGLQKHHELLPFWSLIGVFLSCYVGFLITNYPYIIPPHTMTYIQAAAPESSLWFMFIGACIMLPPLLFYTYYAYKIFSGKVTEHIHY